MKNEKKRKFDIVSKLLRLLPFICIGIVAAEYLRAGRSISMEDLISYSPEEPLLAAAFLLLAFAFKSMTFVMPVMLIFAVSGSLFPLPTALLLNTAGIAITISLPYLIGRGFGRDLTEHLLEKYPKLVQFRTMRNRNNLFFSFILRTIGVLPCDVVSIYMGNTGMPYLPYIIGGVLGFMPDLICATLMGRNIDEPASPGFLGSLGVNVLICAASCIGYKLYREMQKKKEKDGRENETYNRVQQ